MVWWILICRVLRGRFKAGGGVESSNNNSVCWDALQLQLQFRFEYDFNLLYNYHKLIFLFDDTLDSPELNIYIFKCGWT